MRNKRRWLSAPRAGFQPRLLTEVRADLPAQSPAGSRASFPAPSAEREKSSPHPGPPAGHSPVLGGFLFTFIQSKVCAGGEVSVEGERAFSLWPAWRGDRAWL